MLGIVLLFACRGTPPSAQSVDERQLAHLVDSLMPAVSRAAGRPFTSTPRSAVRSRDQIRAYLVAKVARELPPERLEGITDTYRLFGMIPDSIDLRRLFVDLYTEQVAGFYDPDSTTLFAVAGADPAQLRLVLAHEMVHALQHQYLALDSILQDASDGDRQAAAQAILEGQATIASLVALVPGMDLLNNDGFWTSFREQLRVQQAGTSVFARAPMAVRETLVFPYVDGAEFMRWFDKAHPGDEPYGAEMPSSTEQILHTDRYAARDQPITVRFRGDTAGLIFEDTFGEFDTDLLLATLRHADEVKTDSALGWGGDRFRVYRTADGPALIWISVWDTPSAAAGFEAAMSPLVRAPRAGYRSRIEPIALGTGAAARLVIAPDAWPGWKVLPTARIER
ncbi:MAG: hypothetical protein ACREL5_02455 [Gemmatimonadales bacterium]